MPYEERQHREPSRKFWYRWRREYQRLRGREVEKVELLTAWYAWVVPIYRKGASAVVAAHHAQRCEALNAMRGGDDAVG